MTNQVTPDAEESSPIEKTASEQPETTTDTTRSAAQNEPAGSENPAAAQNAGNVDNPTTDSTANVSGVVGEQRPAADARQVSAPQEATPQQGAPALATAPAQASAPAEASEEAPPAADIDFGAILEQFEQEQTVYHSGEMVNGTVVGVTDRGVLVDFGHKSEGYVPLEEFTGPDGEITATVGEPVEVIIRSMHSGEGAPLLSRQDALGRKVWDEIEAAYQAETPITGRVVDKTKGGLRVDINGIEAFLPGSQIDSRPIRGLDTYIGTEIEAKIIKFSRRRNNIVLSRKVLTDEVVNVQKAETLGKVDIGFIVDGTVKNLTEYGAFVDIGGIDGLLHVTDMSWGRIHHPGDLFKVGDHVQVKVLKLDREKEKVSLGFKQLQPDPWSTVVEVYPVNTKLTGKVSSVTDYGVFVELEAGVEGLVHVSEISWARRSQSPKRMFQKGQEVEVQVLGVDTVEKRISLGMKQFQENPWDTVDIRYPVGARVQGRVRNLTDFGAFVELEEGIDGLVHVSDISWAKKIKHPKDVLKKDQEVEAIVTSIDKRGQRLSLSMKDLTPSAWEGFVATHRPGDVVKGKVSRFTNFGVFVELGEGLEGLCHISELSDDRVERAEDVAQLGQEMDFKILRIEPADQKIGLSHRAVGKESEAGGGVDSRMYSTEAKSGMASLGELAKLRGGSDEAEAAEDPEERKRAKQAAKKARAEEFAAREAEAAANPQPEPSGTDEASTSEADEAAISESGDASTSESGEGETTETDNAVTSGSGDTANSEVSDAGSIGSGAAVTTGTEGGEVPEGTDAGNAGDGDAMSDESAAAQEETQSAPSESTDSELNEGGSAENATFKDAIGGGDLTAPATTEETALDAGPTDAQARDDSAAVSSDSNADTEAATGESHAAADSPSETGSAEENNSGSGDTAATERSPDAVAADDVTSSDQADGSGSTEQPPGDREDTDSQAV